jgi:hypothetical protein
MAAHSNLSGRRLSEAAAAAVFVAFLCARLQQRRQQRQQHPALHQSTMTLHQPCSS